jgi:integrase
MTFLQHCSQTRDPLAELYELILCTGMRKGEALALHWADIDLDAQVLFVRKARPSLLVSHVLKLTEAPAGYDHFDKRDDGWTKVVLHP